MEKQSHDAGSLNFDKLEKELHNAVEFDKRYWVENDAKFRAINQKVESYEEFKDIVKASHLKPLEKGDNFQNVKFDQTWNAHANKNQNLADTKVDSNIQKSACHIPKNSQEFAQYWRRYYKTTLQQYQFLTSVGGAKLLEIFKTEISFGLLGDIVKALDGELKPEDSHNVLDILDNLSNTKRFSLSLQFLSSKEKDVLTNLVKRLSSDDNIEDTDYKRVFENVMKKYEIKIES